MTLPGTTNRQNCTSILQALTHKGELTTRQLVRETGLPEDTIRRHLNDLSAMGMLGIKQVKRSRGFQRAFFIRDTI
ncbi:MAG: ArsR family transcriptional regulator [Anaerolineae bacterium]